MKDEIIIYQADELSTRLEVRIEELKGFSVVAKFATTTQYTVIRTNYEKYSSVVAEQCAKNAHCKFR